MLRDGGNAADAALAAAAALCVTEPMMTGVGGDAFAIVWRDGQAEGLDAAGPAPAGADPDEPVAWSGPRSVTVPGAVAGWAALAERYGRFGLDRALWDAIALAEEGFEVQPVCAGRWAASEVPEGFPPAPAAGERLRLEELGATLRAIALYGPDAIYRGPAASAIAAVSWLTEDDLAAYEPRWVEPLRVRYRDVEVLELPPPTQGVAALEGLALLEGLEPTRAAQIACVRLALEDAFARVRDEADVADLIAPDAVARRRADVPPAIHEPPGGTVYLCAVDDDGMAVSFIQSLFESFGSGVVAPGTGVVLQNRGACFGVQGGVVPGARPYHTIIPGLLLRDGALWGPFGVMGGFLQAQAHVQLVSALVDRGLDPQAALDEPRFRVEGDRLALEPGLTGEADALAQATGLDTFVDPVVYDFGGGQAILAGADGELRGGSDRRKDGYAGSTCSR